MANKLSPEVMGLLKSDNPYDWMTFIREYCQTYGYKVRWNTALSKQFYGQLREIISRKLMSSTMMYQAIHYHCKSPHYLRILIKKGIRYNIQGKPDGKVSKSEGDFAWAELCKFHPKAAQALRSQHRKAKVIQAVGKDGKTVQAEEKPKGRKFNFKPRK